MLDWGGGIGHYYLLAKNLMPALDIEYHCKDAPVFAEHGQKLFHEASFHTDNSCLDRQYELVFASGSLQYSQDWSNVFSRLAAAASNYLLITRLPTVKTVPSYVFIQRPYLHGYNTEYLAWCLNRDEFMHVAQATGMQLMREFLVGDNHPIPNAPERCEYYGFLFKKPAEI
jgi:putative methyltransferase (TIGR04325 family)